MPNVIVIGSGANGLVAAAYLAKAGVSTLVLERREEVGGTAVTGDIVPGFRASTLAHVAGPLRPAIVRDLGLAARGLRLIEPDPPVVALDPDGRALAFHRDAARTARALTPFSARDAARYPEFAAVLEAIGRFLRPLLDEAPPSLDQPGGRDLWSLLSAGRRFRRLGRKNGFRLLRYMPMAVADLVDEWLDTGLARAAVAARALAGTSLGPRAAGTGANLLLTAATDPAPAGGACLVAGGLGALTGALAEAARRAGAEIRTSATVARIVTRDGRATGVVLESGEEIAAGLVVSNADPKHTLLGLVDPGALDPEFARCVRNIRTSGAAAKINLALDRLPAFTALPAGERPERWLSGRLHVGPDLEYLERAADAAKYGEPSPDPYLDVTIPSIADPSLAPAGKHVLSAWIQYAPYRLRNGDWTAERARLGDLAIRALARYAPDLPELVLGRQVVTPADLETRFALTGGHVFHGVPALDQLFVSRPIYGWARYRTPIAGLYLCGAGTHPGGGVTGASGANAAREILRGLH